MNGWGNVPSCQDAEDIVTGRVAADRETVATRVATSLHFLVISGAEAARYKIKVCGKFPLDPDLFIFLVMS